MTTYTLYALTPLAFGTHHVCIPSTEASQPGHTANTPASYLMHVSGGTMYLCEPCARGLCDGFYWRKMLEVSG